MTVMFLVLPLALLFSGAAVVAFLWSAKSGQLDDLDTPPLRVLKDGLRSRKSDEP
jgi:cbb3-type cytochrome oxidase maturation protein